MKSLQSARYFWDLFASELRREGSEPALEHKRHLGLLGFTALDGALAAWWDAAILPEWDETLSLADTLLADDEALARFVARSGGTLQKGQLVATLRFLRNTGDPERFSPSLCDAGCAFLLMSHLSGSETHASFARELFRLQRLRNQVIHVGRGLSELEAHEAVKSLKRLPEGAALVHPVFSEAFGVEPRAEELAA